MSELKKCPFCGGNARLFSNYSEKAEHYYIFVQCVNCFARGKTIKSEYPAAPDIKGTAGEDAVNAWNRREGVI